MILAVLSPIIVPLWTIAAGLFCTRIGHKAESARLGWLFFIVLCPLPIGAMFALVGLTIPVVVAAVVVGLIIILMFLDWYGDRHSDLGSTRDRITEWQRIPHSCLSR
ncbi:hypothetical protein OIB37_31840 [Streptomyces sp. NBC_00820]|uniref:hypothetical protein n=1 Tax=Streptomyces sp. NBC_00820 TaxID=2975842 RepID=UPI002ED64ED0|nr:hypothetical protein OIB37_31840 [Streptomyces sp. NBC_00820]